jgi:hypothetical protein
VIILDENLNDPEVISVLGRCGPEQINNLVSLGFRGRDDAQISRLLHQYRRCVFLTENTRHFWQRPDVAPAHGNYCIVCIDKPIVSRALPLLFRTPPFSSRKQRSGLIAQVVTVGAEFAVDYYRKEGQEITRVPLST